MKGSKIMGWRDYGYYTPSKPREVKNGIKAKTKRGQFGDTWWSKRWISVLDSFGWDNRLQRGRTYARKGQVIDMEILKGIVISHVQGSRRKPYQVTVEMEEISDKNWEKVSDAMAEQAIFAAKLLAGDMPEDIEDAFEAARVSLFPSKSDLDTDCSCPDWANPCKHIAAVYYLLGESFDEDPFLIFLLRGRSKEELMEMLRQRRADGIQPAEGIEAERADGSSEPSHAAPVKHEPPGLSANSSFWEFREPVDELRIDFSSTEVEVAVLKRLGKPSFWKSRKEFPRLFESVYRVASDAVRSRTDVAGE
ncbi:SWIM zinc finger family protein [Candidatus Poribacteria bacterium]